MRLFLWEKFVGSPHDKPAVLFVHGNVSSSLFWQQALQDVAATGRHRPLAVDLRGYGDTEPLPVDATRGVRDWADDVQGHGIDAGHHVAEEAPGPLSASLGDFFNG